METKIIDKQNIGLAVEALKGGETIAFKTDTIFGLSCLAKSKKACEKLLQIKGRENKPLIVLLGQKMRLKDYVKNIPAKLEEIILRFWPGPLTIIFESKYPFCDQVTCGKSTIAIRVPKDVLTQQILKDVGEPIVSTSANLSGRAPLNSEEDIYAVFYGKIPYVIKADGETSTLSSTIISYKDDQIVVLREGSIKREELLGKD